MASSSPTVNDVIEAKYVRGCGTLQIMWCVGGLTSFKKGRGFFINARNFDPVSPLHFTM